MEYRNREQLCKAIYKRIDFYIRKDKKKFGWKMHRQRLFHSILRISASIEKHGPKRVLVLGQDSVIDWVIRDLDLCQGVDFTFSGEQDLRGRLSFNSRRFDLIINTEVLEHIKDTIGSPRDVFGFSGVKNLLAECSRLLRIGGAMILSTPNSCSRKSIMRALMGRDSKMFFFHVREYAPEDVIHLLVRNHFNVNYLETIDVYNSKECHGKEFDFGEYSDEKINQITTELFARYDFDQKWRGDLIFVECVRVKKSKSAKDSYIFSFG